MDCKNVISQLGGFLDGETDEQLAVEIKNHLQRCERCAALVNHQKIIDQSVRTAVTTTTIDSSALRARVRNALPAEKSFFLRLKWQFAYGGLAAVIVLAIIGFVVVHYYRPTGTHNEGLYTDLVDDYLDHGRPAPADVEQPDDNRVQRIRALSVGVDKIMDSLQQQNYQLVERRLCTLDKTTFLHLIYLKNGKYLSVFFKRVDNPLLTDKPTQTIANVALHECTERGMAVAALQGPHCVVLLIGEFGSPELHNLANATAPFMPAA